MGDVEKFTEDELKALRDELRHSGLDSFQTGELVGAFLAQHGYGVSNTAARYAVSTAARYAVSRMELAGYALPFYRKSSKSLPG